MMTLVWSDEADNDLASIYEYIARDSMYYARRTIEKIITRGKQISAFPYSGTKVPEYQDSAIRQVFEGNYRIIYHIGSDTITVLTIVHGARDLFKDE
jgi:toxin ParE1/3/4